MIKAAALALVAAGCGSDGPSSLVVSTTFTVNMMFGNNSSYLEKYVGQELSFEIEFPSLRIEKYNSTEDCANTDVHFRDAPRIAMGATAAEAQVELLDPLDQDWNVSYELCDDPTRSVLSIDSVIDPYNLSIGCGVVPMDDQILGDDGYPLVTSTTATRCNATILDVINAFTIGNADFSLTVIAS
ncbi:MAG: hypothetical protein ACKV2T_39560 [Kofleriaceae bacterium]